MSSGAFGGVHEKILARLKAEEMWGGIHPARAD